MRRIISVMLRAPVFDHVRGIFENTPRAWLINGESMASMAAHPRFS
jgi:hypothetical protein